MLVEVFLLWFVVWIVFLIMSTTGSKGWLFAAFAGIWSIFMSIHILIDGLQMRSGMDIAGSGGNYTVTYSYTNLVLPFSTYSFIWGMFFLLLGMYLVFIAVMRRGRWS